MNDRFKFRVWDKYAHETPAEQIQFLCFNGCLVDSDGCHHSPDDYIFEQCTGLKDKNGKLVYEGDLLEAGGRRYVVCWAHHGFVMRFTPDSASSYPLGGTDLFEIIGNIHKQKEQQ